MRCCSEIQSNFAQVLFFVIALALDCLNLKSYLLFLACISPLKKDKSATIASLKMAQQAKLIEPTPKIASIFAEIKVSLIGPTFLLFLHFEFYSSSFVTVYPFRVLTISIYYTNTITINFIKLQSKS